MSLYGKQFVIQEAYNLYFLSREWKVDSAAGFSLTCIFVVSLTVFVEFAKFMKWYVVSNKKITANCKLSLINTDKQSQQSLELGFVSKTIAVLLDLATKGGNLLLVFIVLMTYNLMLLVLICFTHGLCSLFFGIKQDNIVIRILKQEKGPRMELAEVPLDSEPDRFTGMERPSELARQK